MNDDYASSFKDLLRKANSFDIYHRNIQSLARELFKVIKGIASPILCDIFPPRSIDYNLRHHTDFSVNCVKNSHFKLNYLQCFASKVWNIIPPELENVKTLKYLNLKS